MSTIRCGTGPVDGPAGVSRHTAQTARMSGSTSSTRLAASATPVSGGLPPSGPEAKRWRVTRSGSAMATRWMTAVSACAARNSSVSSSCSARLTGTGPAARQPATRSSARSTSAEASSSRASASASSSSLPASPSSRSCTRTGKATPGHAAPLPAVICVTIEPLLVPGG
ncbi:hypothetical protein ACOBQX_18330 [Actinokineospora sp. G85]|uniref:hypothetical protein n=1 Tax=Actinokineospora sp. G85 TaxID=3406626 RepID=UPI003C7757EE